MGVGDNRISYHPDRRRSIIWSRVALADSYRSTDHIFAVLIPVLKQGVVKEVRFDSGLALDHGAICFIVRYASSANCHRWRSGDVTSRIDFVEALKLKTLYNIHYA